MEESNDWKFPKKLLLRNKIRQSSWNPTLRKNGEDSLLSVKRFFFFGKVQENLSLSC